jgi:hypothetical protein
MHFLQFHLHFLLGTILSLLNNTLNNKNFIDTGNRNRINSVGVVFDSSNRNLYFSHGNYSKSGSIGVIATPTTT